MTHREMIEMLSEFTMMTSKRMDYVQALKEKCDNESVILKADYALDDLSESMLSIGKLILSLKELNEKNVN